MKKVISIALSLLLSSVLAVSAAAETFGITEEKTAAIASFDNYSLTTFNYWWEWDYKLVADHVDASESEIYEVARVLEHECCGFGDEGRYLVANVIANRVVDSKWPDNVWDVVMQQGQFGDGEGKDPCDDCLKAAKAVFFDNVRVLPAYVCNFQSISEDYWAKQGYACYCKINKDRYTEYFCFDPNYREELITEYIN